TVYWSERNECRRSASCERIIPAGGAQVSAGSPRKRSELFLRRYSSEIRRGQRHFGFFDQARQRPPHSHQFNRNRLARPLFQPGHCQTRGGHVDGITVICVQPHAVVTSNRNSENEQMQESRFEIIKLQKSKIR